MKNTGFIIVMVLFAVLFGSCEKDEITLGPQSLPTGRIKLSDLQFGQRSYYRVAEINTRASHQITYTGDTLVVEIIGREGSTFLVEERFTEGSPNSDDHLYCDAIKYGLRSEGGVLNAVATTDCPFSYLFSSFPQSLPLLPGTDARTGLEGWEVIPFDDGNDDLILNGYVEDVTIAGVLYPHLLVQVDPTLEPLDGNRLSWLYRDEPGIVRAVSVNGFAGRGFMVELLGN